MNTLTTKPLIEITPEQYARAGLDMLSEEERDQFVREIGEIAVESALLQYLDQMPEVEQSVFSSWIQARHQNTNFYKQLEEKHPAFLQILLDEVNHFLSFDPALVRQ